MALPEQSAMLPNPFTVLLSSIVAAQAPAATFTNPIVPSGADPWVIRHAGEYLWCYSGGGGICVRRAARLHEIGTGERVCVWTPPPNTAYTHEIWAPELHLLDGKWYIYFAADDGNNHNHRMYVLESETADPQGAYTFRGKITDPTDRWAIDGTVLELGGARYFVWSGWEGTQNVRQDLYIARMSNPWTIAGERACISTPEHPWERIGRPWVNEGPEVLRKNGKTFIIYSASGSWTDDYCLGQLELVGGDPMRRESWVKKETPVFTRTEQVWGPGHCSFTTSPDGKEDWIVYHAAKHSGAGWNRDVRIQRFTWNADGSPHFGTPIAPGVVLPVPGE